MIIKDINLVSTGDSTVLSARCKLRKIGWDTVYFRFSKSLVQAYVYEDASPFAAALLLPSMKQGEDLVIRGSISEQLYRGMHSVMQEVLGWNIGLKPIEIKAEVLVPDTQIAHRTASFFSGGVDSFYTYLKHRDNPIAAERIDTFILVDGSGFDVDRRNKQLWDRTLENIAAIAAAAEVELVVVETNVDGLLQPILPWDYTHGGCLAAVGLSLRSAFRQIYIPSTHSVDQQIPWGSNLRVDGNWSTEGTTFVHDGTEATRIEKVLWQVARSSLALDHLRVCYKNVAGAYNCGKCDKCLRTMINLYVAGVLDKASTFPDEIDPELVASVPTIAGQYGGIFHNENLVALRERKLSPELQRAISASLDNTIIMKYGPMAKLRDKAIYLDHVYAKGSAYFVLSRLFGRKFP
jgi:hypothetical protein